MNIVKSGKEVHCPFIVKRLENMKDDSLVKLAFIEQKALKLDWTIGTGA